MGLSGFNRVLIVLDPGVGIRKVRVSSGRISRDPARVTAEEAQSSPSGLRVLDTGETRPQTGWPDLRIKW